MGLRPVKASVICLVGLAAGWVLASCHPAPGGADPATSAATTEAMAVISEQAGEGVASASASDTAATPPDLCGAASALAHVGERDSPALRTAVQRDRAAGPVRWIHPGMAVTQDYRETRLNLIFGDDGALATARCG